MLQPIQLAIATDEADSPAFSSQRLVNWYVETSPTKGKSDLALYGTPALKTYASCGDGPIRGFGRVDGVLFVVSGTNLYSVTGGGSATLLATITGSGFVVTATNAAGQLAIATGGATVDYIDGYFLWVGDKTAGGAGFVWDTGTSTLTSLNSNPNFLLEGGAVFQISGINAGTTYDALDFASAESSPDPLRCVFVDHGEAWMMGEETIEPWFDSGEADFPFSRVNQTVISKGLLGRYAKASLDNTIFWAGVDSEAGGGAVVYRADGYTPQRISTHAIERILAGVGNFDAVMAISYVQDGHAFFGLILPNGPAVFYDVATQLWHERETYGLGRWLGNNHIYAYGKHIIGSSRDGKIFEMDQATFMDDGNLPVISRLVSIPLGTDGAYHTMPLFQLDIEGGVGLNTGQGSDPKIMLRYSDDRGRTWSNELSRSLGKIGNYGLRAIWRRLGQFRSRVFELSVSDPVRRVVIQAFADIT